MTGTVPESVYGYGNGLCGRHALGSQMSPTFPKLAKQGSKGDCTHAKGMHAPCRIVQCLHDSLLARQGRG